MSTMTTQQHKSPSSSLFGIVHLWWVLESYLAKLWWLCSWTSWLIFLLMRVTHCFPNKNWCLEKESCSLIVSLLLRLDCDLDDSNVPRFPSQIISGVQFSVEVSPIIIAEWVINNIITKFSVRDQNEKCFWWDLSVKSRAESRNPQTHHPLIICFLFTVFIRFLRCTFDKHVKLTTYTCWATWVWRLDRKSWLDYRLSKER